MNILDKINSIKTQSELNEFKNIVNEAFEKRANFISLCEVADNASKKSFGYIKEAFETISPTLFNITGGRPLIYKYMKTIKENNNLTKLHGLHETVRKANGDTDIDFLTENIINTNWGVDKKTLKEDVYKLGKVLAEGILLIGNDAKELVSISENVKLNKALSFIAENQKTNRNLTKYSDAVKIISEHIANNPKQNVFEKTDIDTYANNLLEAFNKKYTSDLTEDDWKVLKEINQSKNKEEVFNKFKQECVNKLTEAEKKYKNEGANEEQQKVCAVLEKINKKTFVLENITADICGFAEITKIFE